VCLHLRNVFLNNINLKIKVRVPVSVICVLVLHFMEVEQSLSIVARFQSLFCQPLNYSVFTSCFSFQF